MTNFYIVGGTLAADAPSYIKRQADDIFYQSLKNGQFCYILNSRQMGKSSLWVQTQKRLEAEGVRCIDIDLTKIGKSSTEESWYRVIFYELVKSFPLSINPQRKAWWDERSEVSPIQRLNQFVEEVLLQEVEQPIVICFDEIDSVLSLNFAIDTFFAWIRACYNQRANRAIYERLTFCVMGVATVSNFIRDRTRTPFNIGQDIPLSGFTKFEARVLATGLEGKVSNPEKVLEEVLEWTGGQPFLTQKLCQLISESRSGLLNPNSEQEIDVRDFVRSRIIDNWQEQDNPQHLRTIRDRLLLNPSTGRRMLKLYQEILEKGEIPDDSSPDRIQLRLTGLVVQQNGRLIAYNKIYKEVFDRSWVEKELNQIPPFIQQYQAWLYSGKDSLELLSSQDLQEALEWSKDKSLEQSQSRFLQLSQIEDQQTSRERREREAYETAEYILESEFEEEQLRKIINQILSWTRDGVDLIQIVCQLVIEQKKSPEEKSIKELIQEKIIDNWQEGILAEHLKEMQSHLLGKDGDGLSKLQTYKEILQRRVIADEQPEKLALLEVKLIIDNDGWLEIANRIYREVFNLRWVNQELDNLAENDPANVTKLFSSIILVIFSLVSLILVVVQTLRPQKQEPKTIQPSPPVTKTPITPNTPEPSPSITETPTICTKIESTRENDIKKLEALKTQNPNLFSVQCETQLKELKLITRAVGLAKDGIIANNEFGEDAFALLCQIPTDSINIGEAKYWVNRWYEDDLNKVAIDEALKDNPQCEQLIN